MIFSCVVPFKRRKKFRIYRCHPVYCYHFTMHVLLWATLALVNTQEGQNVLKIRGKIKT
jgi:hypothetical protein